MQLVSSAAQPSDVEDAPCAHGWWERWRFQECTSCANVQGGIGEGPTRRSKINKYILLQNVFLIVFACHVHLWYLIMSDVGMLTINRLSDNC